MVKGCMIRRAGFKICCKEKTFSDCNKELINQQTIVCNDETAV